MAIKPRVLLLCTENSCRTQMAEAFLREIDFPQKGANIWELEGVVSRKKQLLPYLLRCVDRMRSA